MQRECAGDRRQRRIFLLGLCILLAGCRAPAYELQRPWASEGGVEQVTLAGRTLPARRLHRASPVQSLPLGEVAAGEVWLDFAAAGPPGSRVEVRLVQHPWPWSKRAPPETCRTDSATWQPCRLRVAASSGAELEIRIDGPDSAEGLISSPLLRAAAAARRPPVFVVLVDTLRFDRLVTYEPSVPLGARLDELARDGIVFERAYSSSSWTRTAVATLFTGLDARSHGVLGRTDVLRPEIDGLPRALQRSGWRTVAWSTNTNVLPMWGLAEGFDVFVDLGARTWATNKTDAGTVFAAVCDELATEGDASSFHYLHLMDPHGPLTPPDADLAAIMADPGLANSLPGKPCEPNDVEDYRRYLAEIRDLDGKLGAFLDDLKRRHLYDDALILVAADHGEEFCDHGWLYHGKTLYEEVIRVPVILKLPGNALAGTRLHEPVGLADMAPTILAALGASALRQPDGRNLWDPVARRLRDEGALQNAVLEFESLHIESLVRDRRKLIVDRDRGDKLFDLQVDPHERRNLLPAAKDEATGLRAALEAICSAPHPERRSATDVAPAVKDRLRALGYEW